MAHPSVSILNRQVTISNENEGPIVNLAAWLGMTLMILCVCTRLFSKWSVVRKWTVDDSVITATMVLAICHTITLSLMVANGLGRPQQTLDEGTIVQYEKYGYASQLLYIPALCLAKLSTLVYLRALSPDTPYAALNRVLELLVVLWGVSSEFAIAFQCSLPTPWAIISQKCFNRLVFWDVIGVFDIVSDLLIISLPGYLVWAVRMPLSKKALVFLVFATRIFITPLTILRIYYFNTVSSPSLPDQTLTSYHAYLATTLQLNFAIFFACIPFLKPFMESMSTGGFTSTLEPMNSSYGAGSKFSTFVSSYTSRKASKPKGSIRMDSVSHHPSSQTNETGVPRQRGDISPASVSTDFHFGLTSPGLTQGQGDLGSLRPDKVTTFSHIRRATPEETGDGSSIGSDKMIIKQTREWDIREDYEVVNPNTSDTVRDDNASVSESVDREWGKKSSQSTR